MNYSNSVLTLFKLIKPEKNKDSKTIVYFYTRLLKIVTYYV